MIRLRRLGFERQPTRCLQIVYLFSFPLLCFIILSVSNYDPCIHMVNYVNDLLRLPVHLLYKVHVISFSPF